MKGKAKVKDEIRGTYLDGGTVFADVGPWNHSRAKFSGGYRRGVGGVGGLRHTLRCKFPCVLLLFLLFLLRFGP